MIRKRCILAIGIFACMALCLLGCSKSSSPEVELKHFPLDNLEGVITKSKVASDDQVVGQGSASLRIDADKPMTVRLFETGDLDVEDARLVYQAKVKTRDVEGQVYLEMWCVFAGKGEFFSRGLQSPLTGTSDWTLLEAPFFLKKGENPDNLKLSIVIHGTGTVWIDDIRIVSGPMK